jgi:hypothetical protein
VGTSHVLVCRGVGAKANYPGGVAARGDLLVRAGAVVFALGVVAVLAIVVPFFFGAHDRPTWLNLSALLLPAGLGVALLGLLRGARE